MTFLRFGSLEADVVPTGCSRLETCVPDYRKVSPVLARYLRMPYVFRKRTFPFALSLDDKTRFASLLGLFICSCSKSDFGVYKISNRDIQSMSRMPYYLGGSGFIDCFRDCSPKCWLFIIQKLLSKTEIQLLSRRIVP
jgi:hypothetical protein